MDLSNQFKYCNTIEDLFKLVRWRDFQKFNSALRRIHSCMSTNDVYDTFWDIMYKISIQMPLDFSDRNYRETLFMKVVPKDFPYICAYCRDAYDVLGSEILKRRSNEGIFTYYTGIVLLMLSFDDQSWTSNTDSDFSQRPYYLEHLIDLFCIINETFCSAGDIMEFVYKHREFLNVRNIITAFANGVPPKVKSLIFEDGFGPNTEEAIMSVFQSIARYYTRSEAVTPLVSDFTDYREEVLDGFFTKYLPHMRRRISEDIMFESYKEDFAWEATANDGMIYMMDHVTYAYSTFPKKVNRLTQEMINTYVDDLVNYVYSTSKIVDNTRFFSYIRDILSLVIPQVDKFPDTKVYIDAALNRAKLPDPIPDTINKQPTIMATEAYYSMDWYQEMMLSAGLEAKGRPTEDENDDPEGRDKISSGSDIQKKSAKKKSGVEESEASRKIYAAWKKTQDNRDKINKYVGIIGRGLKKCLVGDVRTAIIDGKKITPIEAFCRLMGTGAIFLAGGPLAGILATIVQYTAKKSCLNSERKKILLDLERELEIIEEKIEDAKGDGNKQAKYALMRTRNDLKTAISRIKYGLEADDRASATAHAVTSANNPRGGINQ